MTPQPAPPVCSHTLLAGPRVLDRHAGSMLPYRTTGLLRRMPLRAK